MGIQFLCGHNNADSATYYPFGYGNDKRSIGRGRTTGSDVSNSGSVAAGITGGLAPIMVLGYPDTDDPRAIVLVGDSIAAGVGDVVEAKRGFVQIATGTTVPLVNLAISGEQSANFSGRGCQYRLSLCGIWYRCNCRIWDKRHLCWVCHGRDVKGPCYRYLQPAENNWTRAGLRDDARPKNNQYGLLATTTNQTTITSGGSINPEAERCLYNDWVRVETLPPFDGYFDTAALVEANASNVLTPNGGYWHCGSALVDALHLQVQAAR